MVNNGGARFGLSAALMLALAGCGAAEAVVVTRHADEVLVTTSTRGDGADGGIAGRDQPSLDEPEYSFQARFSDALIDFNVCLADNDQQFIGIPGQSADPATLDPDYIQTITTCNNETGLAELLDLEVERGRSLTSLERQRSNEERRMVFDCLVDRGWELGGLEPNSAGLLVVAGYPPDLYQRRDAFDRDLELCGWHDLEFG